MSQIEVELQEWMGSDRAIAEVAWTSSYSRQKKEKKTDEQANALVERLIRDGHSTPVECVVMRFWIRAPIFTDRQHMTHRMASHNGLSGRYRTMPDDFLLIPADVAGVLHGLELTNIIDEYVGLCTAANQHYGAWLDQLDEAQKLGTISNSQYKRAREILRGVLPVSGMTERVSTFNLRSFANYQKLRNSDHAQPEIREVAQKMLNCVEQAGIAPVALKTLKEIGWRI